MLDPVFKHGFKPRRQRSLIIILTYEGFTVIGIELDFQAVKGHGIFPYVVVRQPREH